LRRGWRPLKWIATTDSHLCDHGCSYTWPILPIFAFPFPGTGRPTLQLAVSQ